MFERLSKAGFAPDLSDSGITSLAPGAWVSLQYFFHAPIHYLNQRRQAKGIAQHVATNHIHAIMIKAAQVWHSGKHSPMLEGGGGFESRTLSFCYYIRSLYIGSGGYGDE